MTRILEILNDGKWHTLNEIQQKTEIDQKQAEQAISFLKEYNFIITDKTKNKARLDEKIQQFLTRTATS
jgi:DNA-binding IclR family transcriptional regulator